MKFVSPVNSAQVPLMFWKVKNFGYYLLHSIWTVSVSAKNAWKKKKKKNKTKGAKRNANAIYPNRTLVVLSFILNIFIDFFFLKTNQEKNNETINNKIVYSN